MLSSIFLVSSFSLMERSSSTMAFAFSQVEFLFSWAWITLSILATSLTPVQATTKQPLEEVDLTDIVLFHVLGSTKNLSVLLFVGRNCYQNGRIFPLYFPL